MILMDSAGLPKKRGVIYYIRIYLHKLLKKIHFHLKGSFDYENATPIMKKVLVNAVNNDLTENLKEIKTNTLIIWGEDDSVTPIEHAYKMNELISNSGLVIVPKAGHFSYLDNFIYVKLVINSFLEYDINA